MSESELDVMYIATLACNWMSFDEFVEFVDNAEGVKDTSGVLSLFDHSIH